MTSEKCDICGKHYETVYRVPDEVWEKISHKENGAGMLCIEHADYFARELGIELFFSAGIGEFPESTLSRNRYTV